MRLYTSFVLKNSIDTVLVQVARLDLTRQVRFVTRRGPLLIG
jgi:hypothetical protein